MKKRIQILLIIGTAMLFSCSSSVKLDSFKSIHYLGELSNYDKWDSISFESDSSIIMTLKKDTFQFNFEVVKDNTKNLIFSIGRNDTVGSLTSKKGIVYFKPSQIDSTYKLFDFNAKTGDSWTIKYCGPLFDHNLQITESRNINNEIIQRIQVVENKPFLSHRARIYSFTVSSVFGITEIEVSPGWSPEKINIKNAL
jgi:hypothetical protein